MPEPLDFIRLFGEIADSSAQADYLLCLCGVINADSSHSGACYILPPLKARYRKVGIGWAWWFIFLLI